MYPSEVSRRRPKHLCWTGQWRKGSVSHARQISGVRAGYFCPDACQVSAFSVGLSCRSKRRFDSPLLFCTTVLIYINTKYLIPSCSFIRVLTWKFDILREMGGEPGTVAKGSAYHHRGQGSLFFFSSPQNEVVETVRFWCLFLFFLFVPVSQVQSTSIKFTN